MAEAAAHRQKHERRESARHDGLHKPADTDQKDHDAKRDENLGKSLEDLERLVIQRGAALCRLRTHPHKLGLLPGGDDAVTDRPVEIASRE